MVTMSFLWGLVQIKYPEFGLIERFPLLKDLYNESLTNFLIKWFLFAGVTSSLYYVSKWGGKAISKILKYFKAFFNAKKYL
jgi:hypothetical protein